ncbi:MAG: glutamate-1-semialdehyde 2,1-aminomutase [Terrimicrobiaceae bacterium]
MTSRQLFQAALARIPGGVNSPVRAFRAVGGDPFFVSSASGCRLYTVDGRELIDYVGTWGPAILGHAPDAVIAAVCGAAPSGLSFGVPNPQEVHMAETICELVPSVEKVRMVSSGTEATMSAIRLARGFTGRDKILKFDGCYHGHVDSLLVKAGSGALTHGQPDSAGIPSALAALTMAIPFNDPEAVRAAFLANPGEIAAVILEPVPANAGLYLPEPGYLEFLREITTKEGALLIFDEVMTGFRLAPGGAQEIFGITPDLTALGKVIGGGLPVGAFGGRADIMDHLSPTGPVYQAGTLSGNPLALAAGLAQLRELIRLGGWSRLEEIGQQFEEGVREAIAGRPLTFHRIGSMFCLFFREGPIRNLEEAKASDTAAFARFFHGCLERGVYFAPSQYEAGFLSLAHSEPDIGETLRVVTEVLNATP